MSRNKKRKMEITNKSVDEYTFDDIIAMHNNGNGNALKGRVLFDDNCISLRTLFSATIKEAVHRLSQRRKSCGSDVSHHHAKISETLRDQKKHAPKSWTTQGKGNQFRVCTISDGKHFAVEYLLGICFRRIRSQIYDKIAELEKAISSKPIPSKTPTNKPVSSRLTGSQPKEQDAQEFALQISQHILKVIQPAIEPMVQNMVTKIIDEKKSN